MAECRCEIFPQGQRVWENITIQHCYSWEKVISHKLLVISTSQKICGTFYSALLKKVISVSSRGRCHTFHTILNLPYFTILCWILYAGTKYCFLLAFINIARITDIPLIVTWSTLYYRDVFLMHYTFYSSLQNIGLASPPPFETMFINRITAPFHYCLFVMKNFITGKTQD